MRTSFKPTLLLLSICVLLFSFKIADDPVTIFSIGDSTMCNMSTADNYPGRGWMQMMDEFVNSNVKINNMAASGRSSKSFRSEGIWNKTISRVKAGDYVFIQFGHNDEAKEAQFADRYTPVPDYKTNLIKFITETRAKKAIPILVTPVSRRKFDKDGNAQETHVDYTKAVFEVGEQYKVTVIDLDKKSRELYQLLGPKRVQYLAMALDTGEHPNYPFGQRDNTHFNEYGARRMAEIVLNDIKAQHLDLADRIVKGMNAPTVNPQAK